MNQQLYIEAQFEQLGDWSNFEFSLPADKKISEEHRDDCGNFIIDNFNLTTEELTFEKKYLRGTTHFADGIISNAFSYIILYKLKAIKSKNEYEGTWKNKDLDGFGNSGKSKVKIITKN